MAFVSAMTMTQRIDGEPAASYLELVDLLQSRGAAMAADCRQLFRRSLAINEVETRCDVAIALEACGDYGLSRDAAARIVGQVREAVGRWRAVAEALGISKLQQEEMVGSFEG